MDCFPDEWAGLDVLDCNPLTRIPFHQLFTDVFGAVVDAYGAWLAAPFDDPVKAPDHALGGQGKVDLAAQTFAVEPKVRAANSIDQVKLGASGTANASGLPRFNRCLGLIRRFSSNSQ